MTALSLSAFKNLSLSLTFGILIMMCLGMGIYLVWYSLCFLYLHVYFLHQIKEVFFHYFFLIDFQFLAFSLLLLAPYGMNVGPLEVAPEAVYTTLICLILFPSCSDWLGFFCLFVFYFCFCLLMFQIIDLILGFICSTVVSLQIVLYFN